MQIAATTSDFGLGGNTSTFPKQPMRGFPKHLPVARELMYACGAIDSTSSKWACPSLSTPLFSF